MRTQLLPDESKRWLRSEWRLGLKSPRSPFFEARPNAVSSQNQFAPLPGVAAATTGGLHGRRAPGTAAPVVRQRWLPCAYRQALWCPAKWAVNQSIWFAATLPRATIWQLNLGRTGTDSRDLLWALGEILGCIAAVV